MIDFKPGTATFVFLIFEFFIQDIVLLLLQTKQKK